MRGIGTSFHGGCCYPQGVSGAIKRRGGLQPFRELGRLGAIPPGHAVETSAGQLPFKSIIHVAGINMLWRSSERSIRDSVRHAIEIAQHRGYKSIALSVDRCRIWWWPTGGKYSHHRRRTDEMPIRR